MEKRVGEVFDSLTETDRNTLLQIILKKSEAPNSDKSALYFGGETDLFISVEGETVKITTGDERHVALAQEVLEKYGMCNG